VDIMYEFRDTTGFTPSGKRDWWMDLPVSGEAAWAERAQRRKGKVDFRLAFIPRKFRLGVEPDPFCLELHLPPEGLWTLKDVTASLIAAGEEAVEAEMEAKTAARDAAADALAEYVAARYESGEPVSKNDAQEFLREEGIGRNGAREILKLYAGVNWQVSDRRRGAIHPLLPLISGEVARFSKPAIDKASQTNEPRQRAAQGAEVMVPENPPQERTVEASPPRQEISEKRKTDRRDPWIYPQAQQAGG
jgi:hypothetical protein